MRQVSSDSLREPKSILKTSSKYPLRLDSSKKQTPSVYDHVLQENSASVFRKEREIRSSLANASKSQSILEDRSQGSLRNTRELSRYDSLIGLKREHLDSSRDSKFLPVPETLYSQPNALSARRISLEGYNKQPYMMMTSSSNNNFTPAQASLKDLCVEDKRKVGQLMQRLQNEIGAKEHLKSQLRQNENLFSERLENVERDKQEIIAGTSVLQDKLQQSVRLLQNYREKSIDMKQSTGGINSFTAAMKYPNQSYTQSNPPTYNQAAEAATAIPAESFQFNRTNNEEEDYQQHQAILLDPTSPNNSPIIFPTAPPPSIQTNSVDQQQFFQQPTPRSQDLKKIQLGQSSSSFQPVRAQPTGTNQGRNDMLLMNQFPMPTPINKFHPSSQEAIAITHAQDSLDEEVHEFLQSTISNNLTKPQTQRRASQNTFTTSMEASPRGRETFVASPFARCVVKMEGMSGLISPRQIVSNGDLLKQSSKAKQFINEKSSQILATEQHKQTIQESAPQRVTLSKKVGESERVFDQWKKQYASRSDNQVILANQNKCESFQQRAKELLNEDEFADGDIKQLASLKEGISRIANSLSQLARNEQEEGEKNSKEDFQSKKTGTVLRQTALPSQHHVHVNDESEDEDESEQIYKAERFVKMKKAKLMKELQEIRKNDLLDSSQISTKPVKTKQMKKQPVKQSQESFASSSFSSVFGEQPSRTQKQQIGVSAKQLIRRLEDEELGLEGESKLGKRELKKLNQLLERRLKELSDVSYDVSNQIDQYKPQNPSIRKSSSNGNDGQRVSSQHQAKSAQTPLRQSAYTNTFDISTTQLKDSSDLIRVSSQSWLSLLPKEKQQLISQTLKRHSLEQKEIEGLLGKHSSKQQLDGQSGNYILVQEEAPSIKKQILARIDQLTEEDMATVLEAIQKKRESGGRLSTVTSSEASRRHSAAMSDKENNQLQVEADEESVSRSQTRHSIKSVTSAAAAVTAAAAAEMEYEESLYAVMKEVEQLALPRNPRRGQKEVDNSNASSSSYSYMRSSNNEQEEDGNQKRNHNWRQKKEFKSEKRLEESNSFQERARYSNNEHQTREFNDDCEDDDRIIGVLNQNSSFTETDQSIYEIRHKIQSQN